MRDESPTASPLVSVVIPTFERREPVQEAIDSVLRQDAVSLDIRGHPRELHADLGVGAAGSAR
jgi:hypothetical protein